MSSPDRSTISHREFVALMASCMGMAALSIDLMLPAFSDMREEFGLSPASTAPSWIVTAFFLGLAVGQLVYGPMSDRHGRKPMLYAGLTIMAVAAAAAALAPSLGVVIGCRVLWGMGAAGPRSLAVAMIRDRYGGDRMARTMSYVMTTFVLVPVLAPSVGSGLLAVGDWRLLFWLPCAIALGVMLWVRRRLPETLLPEHRRTTSPRAIMYAAREVVRTPQTAGLAITLTCITGIMTAYVGSAEIIIDDVLHSDDKFPIIFGVLAVFLATGSFVNGQLVTRVGLTRMLRYGATYLVSAAALLAVVAMVTDGKPPLVLFGLAMALLLPALSVLIPNSNSAAMLPLPHVAGTGAAVLGTMSAAGGALLGSVLDASFDGTIGPFAWGVLIYAAVAAAAVLTLGVRAVTPAPRHADAVRVGAVPADD